MVVKCSTGDIEKEGPDSENW